MAHGKPPEFAIIEGLSVRAEIDRAPGQHWVRCQARLARCGRLKKERSPGRGRSGALVCRVSPRFWQIVMAGKVPRPPRFRQQPRIRKDARVTFLPKLACQR